MRHPTCGASWIARGLATTILISVGLGAALGSLLHVLR